MQTIERIFNAYHLQREGAVPVQHFKQYQVPKQFQIPKNLNVNKGTSQTKPWNVHADIPYQDATGWTLNVEGGHPLQPNVGRFH